MNMLSRRGFLAASAAAIGAAHLPRIAFAQGVAPISLSAATRTLDIDGRAATVFGLAGPGGQGLILDPGQRFRVDLTNDLDVGTIIHWHGQIPPNAQDGVPDMPMPLLAPGETRSYDFEARPGTHWMHSHVPTQEMQLLAAPLIVRSAEDVAADRQEVVMFLHDFSFKSPEEVLAEISGGHAGGGHGAHAHHGGAQPMQGTPMGGMGELRDCDDTLMCTFAELDRSPEPNENDFLGPIFSLGQGVDLPWPAASNARTRCASTVDWGQMIGRPRASAARSTSARSGTRSAAVTARCPPATEGTTSSTTVAGRSTGQNGNCALCSSPSIAWASKPTFSIWSAVVEYCWT